MLLHKNELPTICNGNYIYPIWAAQYAESLPSGRSML